MKNEELDALCYRNKIKSESKYTESELSEEHKNKS